MCNHSNEIIGCGDRVTFLRCKLCQREIGVNKIPCNEIGDYNVSCM